MVDQSGDLSDIGNPPPPNQRKQPPKGNRMPSLVPFVRQNQPRASRTASALPPSKINTPGDDCRPLDHTSPYQEPPASRPMRAHGRGCGKFACPSLDSIEYSFWWTGALWQVQFGNEASAECFANITSRGDKAVIHAGRKTPLLSIMERSEQSWLSTKEQTYEICVGSCQGEEDQDDEAFNKILPTVPEVQSPHHRLLGAGEELGVPPQKLEVEGHSCRGFGYLS